MTRTVVAFSMVLLGLVASAAYAQTWQEKEVDGFTLRWATMPGDMLSVELTGPTTGWVAAGFDPEMMMNGANLIIGYVSGSTPSLRDDYGVANTGHQSDTSLGGTDDVTVDGGSESGGETTIEFTIPLDSGDSYDKPLVPGSTYDVILARGPNGSDDFTTYHAFATSTTIEIMELSLEEGSWAGVKAGF